MDAKARLAPLVFVFVIAIGTVGYHYIENWAVADSFYMTVITLSTVGYGEVRPLSDTGKVFTSVLIFIGVGSLAFVATQFTEAIVERGLLRKRRAMMQIKKLRDHVVVCGYGRMGAVVVEELRSRKIPFLVIENDPDQIHELESKGYPFLAGDATDDEALLEAGIERARAMAAVLPHDAENLFVTLSSRNLNPSLTIIARSSNPKNDAKLKAAGAARVLNPFLSGGRLMARQLLHPSVTELIEGIWRGIEVGLEEVIISEGSPLVGMSLRESPIRGELEIMVIGIQKGETVVEFNPTPDQVFEAGDTLVALGNRDNLQRLERLAEPGGSA